MFQWALSQLDKHERKLVIMDRFELEPYLERYYIAWPDSVKRERKDIPFNSFIHRFMQSDDPVFHNHPWNWYYTVIIKGGYWEHTPWETKWRGPGTTKFIKGGQWKHAPTDPMKLHDSSWADPLCLSRPDPSMPLIPADLHWVEIPKKGETYTLFTRGRTTQEWGFVPDPYSGKWIQHEIYLAEQKRLYQEFIKGKIA